MSQRFDVPGAQNLEMSVVGSVLYLYCDLSRSLGASSSGKSVLISSSSGNKPLGKSGAFIGFNVFTKSLDRRDLSTSGVGELRQKDFTAVGDGCQWRVEEDAKTLCVKIDFDAVTARAASSGKSMLLATTSGNKPIASSGLSCGLNCYYPTAGTFAVARLAEGAAPEDELQVGQSRSLEGGFTVTYAAVNKLTMEYTYRVEDMADGHVTSTPSFRLGDLTVVLSVAAVKAARARKETTGASTKVSPGQSTTTTTTSPHGGFLQEGSKEEKVRNVTATCTAAAGVQKKQASNEDADPDVAYDLVFTVDPTRRYGRSSSGKSLTVASTGGFQHVVDRDGRVVCRANLNSYRPAPPITDEEVARTVKKVLAAKPQADLAGLSFKDVLAEVMAGLGAGEAMKEGLRGRVKEEVAAFVKNLA